MRTRSRTFLSTTLAITSVVLAMTALACAHRRQIYDSSDFARRPAERSRPTLAKSPAKNRLANEPKLARVVDEADDRPERPRDEADDGRD